MLGWFAADRASNCATFMIRWHESAEGSRCSWSVRNWISCESSRSLYWSGSPGICASSADPWYTESAAFVSVCGLPSGSAAAAAAAAASAAASGGRDAVTLSTSTSGGRAIGGGSGARNSEGSVVAGTTTGGVCSSFGGFLRADAQRKSMPGAPPAWVDCSAPIVAQRYAAIDDATSILGCLCGRGDVVLETRCE